jgi:hypothetical protein
VDYFRELSGGVRQYRTRLKLTLKFPTELSVGLDGEFHRNQEKDMFVSYEGKWMVYTVHFNESGTAEGSLSSL